MIVKAADCRITLDVSPVETTGDVKSMLRAHVGVREEDILRDI